MLKPACKILTITILALCVISCNPKSKIAGGAVAGGVTGGLIGSQIGSGTGNTAAIIGGTLAGSAIGGVLGFLAGKSAKKKGMDTDYIQIALDKTPTNDCMVWKDEDSKIIVQPRSYIKTPIGYCRAFEITEEAGDQIIYSNGTACKKDDGLWQKIIYKNGA